MTRDSDNESFPLQTYKMLLFDLDGTLFDYDQAYRQALTDTVPELMHAVGTDAVIDSFHQINLALWKDVEQGKETVDRLRSLRFSKLLDDYQWDTQDPEVLGQKYIRILAAQAQLIGGAKEVLTELETRFRMGIITNGIAAVQRQRLQLSGLNRFFDPIVISLDYEISKPDPEIFNIATKLSGLPREAVLYIGDSISSDMVGAQNAGIDFCWFNPEKIEVPDTHEVRFNIRSLSELPGIL